LVLCKLKIKGVIEMKLKMLSKHMFKFEKFINVNVKSEVVNNNYMFVEFKDKNKYAEFVSNLFCNDKTHNEKEIFQDFINSEYKEINILKQLEKSFLIDIESEFNKVNYIYKTFLNFEKLEVCESKRIVKLTYKDFILYQMLSKL
jgi:hypothetical protein